MTLDCLAQQHAGEGVDHISERHRRPTNQVSRHYPAAGALRERLPTPALRPHIDRVWINELDAPIELDIIPDGCIDIYWTGSRLYVAGPGAEVISTRVERAASLVGVRFRPGIAVRWLGVSAANLLGTHPLLDDVWSGGAARRLADELGETADATRAAGVLERSLVERLDQVAPADPIVSATATSAERQRPFAKGIVRGLVEEFGWSERTLRRHCLTAFGYGPKTLERVLRFQRFLHLHSRGLTPLAGLAIEAGYADQAHLTREVRRLAGQSPARLISGLRS